MVAGVLAAASAALTPIAGPAQGGSIVILPLPAGCSVAACKFGAAEATAATIVGSSVFCTSPPALLAGVATSMLEADSLNASIFYGVAQPDGEQVQLTRTGAQVVGVEWSAPSFENIGTLVVPPPLTSSLPSAAVRLSFELLVGRGTGGQGFSVSFAPVPRGMLVDERGVTEALAVSFAR